MFAEQDVRDAAQVEPLDDSTGVSVRTSISTEPARRLTALAPVVVIFSVVLLTAPAGAVLQTAVSTFNATRSLWSEQKRPSGSYSVEQGDTRINANNSNVQNVQVNNNGGQVTVTLRK